MRKSLLLSCVLLLFVSAQVASNPIPEYQFGLFADSAGTWYMATDDGPGTLTVYMVLKVNYGEVGALKFSAPKPSCFNGTLIEETYTFPRDGTAETGVWVYLYVTGYGHYVVGTMTFAVEGLTGDCCWFHPLPYPGEEHIVIEEWPSQQWLRIWGVSSMVINYHPYCDDPVPVEASTWGKIKSLYNE